MRRRRKANQFCTRVQRQTVGFCRLPGLYSLYLEVICFLFLVYQITIQNGVSTERLLKARIRLYWVKTATIGLIEIINYSV